MWGEDLEEVDAELIRKAVTSNSETVIKGWLVIFVNEYNQEQERLLLLTDQAYYRIKYNFKDKKILRFQKILLTDISGIQIGNFKPTSSGSESQKGFRIFNRELIEDTNTYAPNLFQRTFRPQDNRDAEQIVRTFEKAIRQAHIASSSSPITSNFGELVEEVGYLPTSSTPMFAKAHNALGLGIFSKRKSLKTSSSSLKKSNEEKDVSDISTSTSSLSSSPCSEVGSMPEENHPLASNNLPDAPMLRSSPKSSTTFEQKPELAPTSTTDNAHHLMKKAVSVGSDLSALEKKGPISHLTTTMHKKSGSVGSDLLFMEDNTILPSRSEPDLRTASATIKPEKVTPPVKTTVPPYKTHSRTNSTTSEKDFAPAPISPGVSKFFQYLDTISYLWMSVIVSFIVGYFNFSFLWILGVLFLVYKIDKSRQERIFKKKRREAKRPTQPLSRWQRAVLSDPENCNWVNILFTELWPYMSLSIAETTKETLKVLLEESMNQKKPTAVESITISEINFGSTPPTIKNVCAVKPPFPDYRLEFDISYSGPAQILLEVFLGGKYVNLKLPVAINEFELKGRMRVEFTFCPKSPYIHTFSYAFITHPQVGVSIKPLKTIDLMEIPLLKDSIEESLKYLIRTTCVLPEQMVIPYFAWYAKEEDIRHEELERHQVEIEKSIAEGEFAGLLHVRILEARKMIIDKIGVNSQPYCIITTGDEVFTSSAVKRAKNLVWNEFFELLVKKNREKKVEITIMARDTENGDDFLGTATLDFSEFKETKDTWAKLETMNKKGVSVVSGEVHVQCRFIPTPDLLYSTEN